jgi:hypothetical protein
VTGPDGGLNWPRAAAAPSRYLIVTSLRQCRTEINGNESGRIKLPLGRNLWKSKARFRPV